MLNYALKNGHGVGTHCDTDREEKDYNSLLNEYKKRKSQIDSVVGKENNLGCSGGWSYADWARAAYDVGFSYLDAPVVMAYLAIPLKNRPINPETGKPFSDAEIKNLYYHDPIPEDINERITPRFLENTKDFEADDSGILFLTGSLGEIASLAEGRKNCFPNCSLTKDDTDYIIENIDNLKNQGGVLYLHFPVYTLKRNDPKIVEEWLKIMQEYQNQGIIKWESMKDIFEEYKHN